KRGFFQLTALSFTFALGAVFMIIVYLIAIAVVPIVLNFVGMSDLAANLIYVLRWPTLMVMSMAAIALLNRYGPSREKPKWQWVTPGSLFVMVAWVVMSIGFSIYISNFANYDKTYGSLGAAIGVMMWVWLSTYILLIGAALNAEMEHQTAIDTTTGTPQPMGERGAQMADTVGKARNRT
ncbi:MAG: ribonuclease, partial [Pseudomonas fluorescens]